MNKSIDTKTLGVIGSSLVLILTLAAFFWLWSSARPAAVVDTAVDQKYQRIEIDGLKADAEALIANKQNAGSLPVQTPTADKMGRDNPFSGS